MTSPWDDDRITIPSWIVWIVGTLGVLSVLGLAFIYWVAHNLSW